LCAILTLLKKLALISKITIKAGNNMKNLIKVIIAAFNEGRRQQPRNADFWR
jgi:hypothetical protein